MMILADYWWLALALFLALIAAICWLDYRDMRRRERQLEHLCLVCALKAYYKAQGAGQAKVVPQDSCVAPVRDYVPEHNVVPFMRRGRRED